tara:strand:+ start:297 stop:668 length:372 start_codon:yes stop_codon:yes gene_type:complete
MNLYLVAKGGDCSNGAMGDSNDAILIESKHYDLVINFLRAQFDFEMEVLLTTAENELIEDWMGHFIQNDNIVLKYTDLANELLSKNIFKDKYHCRTFWSFIGENALYDHQPVSIDDVLVEFKQ